MGIIRQRFTLEGSRGKRGVEILVDTGASECLVQPELAEELAILEDTAEPMSFDTSGQRDGLKAKERVMLDVRLNGQRHAAIFYVVPGLTEDAVIGAAFLQCHRCRIDYNRKRLSIGKCCVRFRA